MRLAHQLARPRVHKALRAIVLALAVVFLMQAYRKAMRPGGYDFTSYRQSAAALASGADPYRTTTPFPYIYPLFLAFVLIPLTHIPYGVAVVLWFTLGATSLYLALGIAARSAAPPSRGALAVGASLLVMLGALDPIQIDLLNGQVNAEVLLLCLLFFVLYEEKKPAAAAACLAAAAAIKIVPLVLLLFLAVRRDWRVLIGTLAGAIGLSLVPAVVVGDRIGTLYASYAREFLLARAHAAAGAAIDFTPYGFIGRLVPAFAGSPALRFGSVILILGAIASVQWRQCDASSRFRFLALYLALVPLLSPLSEVHHLIFALPAAVLLSVDALDPEARAHRVSVACAALFWCGLWAGRLDRPGPYYFVALAALVIGLLAGATPPPLPSPAPPPLRPRAGA